MSCRRHLDSELAALEAGAGGETGPRYWRSLEELSHTEAFQRLMEREFPSQLPQGFDALSRRKFLTLMGASLALAGLQGCSIRPAPSTQIVPYVRPPEELVPGKPLFYATSMTLDGGAVGLLVETHMGRPTKIEGNPDHPASLGATTPIHQASVLSLYDPDRSQMVRYLGQPRTWEDAVAAIKGVIETQRTRRGAGFRVLTESVVSPTLAGQLQNLLAELPAAKWHVYEPLAHDSANAAARLAFGEVMIPRYDFTKADVVVSLDADFLTSGPACLRYAADFMQRRRVSNSQADARQSKMNRLYSLETALTCTGAKADHRLAVLSRQIEPLARALAAKLGVTAGGAAPAAISDDHEKWITAIARDLQQNRGQSLVIAGNGQPAAVHLLAHAINDRLGNVGRTVEYTLPVDARPVSRIDSLRELTDDIRSGAVECLLILGGNPALTAPADLQFVDHLIKVPMRFHFGFYEDETARLCHWHLPEAHYLEAWSDSRAYDGTASIVQPTIEPMYEGRSIHEAVALFTNLQVVPGRQIVRAYWQQQWRAANDAAFETRWETALHDGIVAGSKFEPRAVTLAANWQNSLGPGERSKSSPAVNRSASDELEIVYLADPTLYDGRFANNGWLQELPKPITKFTWGNAAIMSPQTAERFGLKMGSYAHGGEHGGYHMSELELKLGERSARAPLWIMPGHADGSVTVFLGNGRTSAGHIGGNQDVTVGFNAYALRTSDQPWFASGLTIADTGRTELVACTQQHHSMEGRETVRSASLDEYRQNPQFASDAQERERQERSQRTQSPLTLYKSYDYELPKHKWGMSIDLTSCIGCNACVAACQAENNIPIVGKEQVARGREMHWIRVDRYLEGPADNPNDFHFQPVPCMHCENAPCEYVCPVEATVHSAEGLNDMIYNRCVGTRFCSNNCPYKVRRFNFMAYADFHSGAPQLQLNPDVTVRSRGVMEKCTYCVQRIRQAEIGAETAERDITDGDVLTACQAACPTRAIVFGDINDAQSQVRQTKESPLNYSLLEDLNTVPRTTYLAALRNPNPELENG